MLYDFLTNNTENFVNSFYHKSLIMKSIRKRSYKGIEYIRLSELSEELSEEINNWLSNDVLIKIKTEDGILRDCIQVKDFLYWFENLYTTVQKEEKSRAHSQLTKTVAGFTYSLES